MTYSLYDSRGYVGDLASGGGLEDMESFLWRYGEPFTLFFKKGYTENPERLIDFLVNLKTTDKMLQETLDNFRNLLKNCHDIAIISDGTESIEYTAIKHGGPGSGHFGHAGRPGEVGGSAEGEGGGGEGGGGEGASEGSGGTGSGGGKRALFNPDGEKGTPEMKLQQRRLDDSEEYIPILVKEYNSTADVPTAKAFESTESKTWGKEIDSQLIAGTGRSQSLDPHRDGIEFSKYEHAKANVNAPGVYGSQQERYEQLIANYEETDKIPPYSSSQFIGKIASETDTHYEGIFVRAPLKINPITGTEYSTETLKTLIQSDFNQYRLLRGKNNPKGTIKIEKRLISIRS